MGLGCVVLDFDGTFTNVDAEAVGFEAAFPRLVEDVLGEALGPRWSAALRAVKKAAPEEAWTFDGLGVAPADADPYIRASCAAQHLFDAGGYLKDAGLRGDVITSLYKHAYKHTSTAFRPEAKDVLEGLLARGVHVYVVTNAATDVAARKLDELGPKGRDRIHVLGDARKFLIGPPRSPDARLDAVPPTQKVKGLSRPIQLRRGAYVDALGRVWRETGVAPKDTLVCGDIYELDLALPAALGCSVHMVLRPTTHAYERTAITQLGGRAALSDGLKPLLNWL